jgi:hypothetical protein
LTGEHFDILGLHLRTTQWASCSTRLAMRWPVPILGYEPFTRSDPDALRASLRPGDVLLVEGNNRISGVIKYLTQSTWSHAALYVGSLTGRVDENGAPHVLVEVDMSVGVTSAPLSKYLDFHTRVCRAVGLSDEDCAKVCSYAVERIGCGYDLKNISDLARYLIPLPVPQRWQRRMIALGSGDPTRLICSTLIAQAFEAVRYPLLPRVMLNRKLRGAPGNPTHPPFFALRAARFRHFSVLSGDQADHRNWLQLQATALERLAIIGRRSIVTDEIAEADSE